MKNDMNLTDKLMHINLLIHDNGGVNFVMIREAFNQIDAAVLDRNPKALELDAMLDKLIKLLELCVERK